MERLRAPRLPRAGLRRHDARHLQSRPALRDRRRLPGPPPHPRDARSLRELGPRARGARAVSGSAALWRPSRPSRSATSSSHPACASPPSSRSSPSGARPESGTSYHDQSRA